MTRILVDSEEVLAANSVVQQTIQKLQGDVATLHSQLTNLQGSWQGQAANSFQELAAKWRTTAGLVEQQLGEIGQALTVAAKQYAEIEAMNQRLFLA
ncbi:MAG: WXG100 family type VII secretion target [Micrococcales bacterium]|jgi:early secretory antigenic target protein ESAT-6